MPTTRSASPSTRLSHGLQVALAAVMYRNQERIHLPLADHPDGVRDGIPMQDTETAIAGGVDPGSLAWEQHRRNRR